MDQTKPQKTYEQLLAENESLRRQNWKFQQLEMAIADQMSKAERIINDALYNAGQIIAKTVDFSFLLKTNIIDLLQKINLAKGEPTEVIRIIDAFLVQNQAIFTLEADEEAIKNFILEYIHK